ncbi:MAG: hypothetical protein HFH68_09290 [Lachnospiraceae bacterium]|nr:hypothetical protein [Lachnospiraceae bacterium]
MPYGNIYDIDSAMEISERAPFFPNWFVFGKDNYFSYWLCFKGNHGDGCYDIHPQKPPDKEKKNALKMEVIKKWLPDVFHQFMYGETVKRMKTTFCIWKTGNGIWSRSDMAGTKKDGSAEMLDILDKNPQKYIEFCQWYYGKNIPLNIVEKVYHGEPFTIEIIDGLNNEITDIELVINKLTKMKYPYLL